MGRIPHDFNQAQVREMFPDYERSESQHVWRNWRILTGSPFSHGDPIAGAIGRMVSNQARHKGNVGFRVEFNSSLNGNKVG